MATRKELKNVDFPVLLITVVSGLVAEVIRYGLATLGVCLVLRLFGVI